MRHCFDKMHKKGKSKKNNFVHTDFSSNAIMYTVKPPIHDIVLLHPIRRNTFSEKTADLAVFFVVLQEDLL